MSQPATIRVPPTSATSSGPAPRWSVDAVIALFELPFNDLLFRAQEVHRANHAPNAVQLSTLVSIKTGGCPEDCGYCPQAARYHTGVDNDTMLDVAEVVVAARVAKAAGASRFCMGAAWRGPKDRDIAPVLAMISEVRALGMETCATLGMLKAGQAERLREAGLDYYNHNLTRRPNSMARSFRRATTRTGSTRWTVSAMPECTSVAAASWAWASRGARGPA